MSSLVEGHGLTQVVVAEWKKLKVCHSFFLGQHLHSLLFLQLAQSNKQKLAMFSAPNFAAKTIL